MTERDDLMTIARTMLGRAMEASDYAETLLETATEGEPESIVERRGRFASQWAAVAQGHATTGLLASDLAWEVGEGEGEARAKWARKFTEFTEPEATDTRPTFPDDPPGCQECGGLGIDHKAGCTYELDEFRRIREVERFVVIADVNESKVHARYWGEDNGLTRPQAEAVADFIHLATDWHPRIMTWGGGGEGRMGDLGG